MKKIWTYLLMISLLTSTFFGSGVAVDAASVSATLSGKSALFTGDSIVYGYGEAVENRTPRSWALRIRDKYNMSVTNKGFNGHSLTDVRLYPNEDKRLHTKCFPSGNYDYVILQGGINDVMGAEPNKGVSPVNQAVPVGKIAATKNLADFDTDTFAGGLERYFYYATTNYPNARIGFIITYQMPNSNWGGRTKDASEYWDIAREICAKWDVPYLDLFDDKYSMDILKANTNVCLIDTLHLGSYGYDMITDPIAEWMATLQQYGRVDVKVTTTTTTTTKKPTTSTSAKKPTTTTSAANVGKNTTTVGNQSTTTTNNAVNPIASNSGDTTTAFDKADSTQTNHIVSNSTEPSEEAIRNNVPSQKDDTESADKPNYTWLVIVLVAATIAVLATVIIVALRTRG